MCHPDWVASVGEGARADVPLADGGSLPTWRYVPDGAATARPVLLLPDIYGPLPFYRHLAELLADAGHPVALVDLFHHEGPLDDPTDREQAFARLACHDVVRAVDEAEQAAASLAVTGRPTGVLGFCIGGQQALVLAARRADLVTLTYYAFTEGLPRPVARPAPRPIDLTTALNGPILGFWGDQDYIPVEAIARFGEAAEDAGVDHDIRILEGAGHGFLQGIVEDRGDSAVAQLAWAEGRRFLAEHLAGHGEPLAAGRSRSAP
ncbi:Putative carboxymethylenebutenolidase [Euzebya pacifica]|uniref:Carboxymethylenebutenolidase n=1 Tax=Euzebya pacifica TaxID=1608957 RepID=A0A346Y3G0_9ACTN|nr:dienelactone hydrolase family protein [Euzebya pacifica]AXV09007.1 Putative carboxymethylenebutenolidase [Euzebya pacifica]